VVLDQKAQLLDQVLAEQVGPGDRGRIGAGRGDMAERQPRVGLAKGRHRQPDLGVKGAHPRCRPALVDRLVEVPRQMRRRLGIQPLQLGHRGLGIGKGAVGARVGKKEVGRVVLHRVGPSI
jgi:hypothetical protein